MYFRKYANMTLGIIWVAAIMIVAISQAVFSQSIDCRTIPNFELKQDISTNDEYAIWVLAQKETPTATPYVHVDGSRCRELALPAGDGWEWVTGVNGLTLESLAAGSHSFSFSVNGGAVLFDKVLVTNDKACIPVADGSNCIENTLDFVIDGILQDSTVAGERRVSAMVASEMAPKATYEFFLDGQSMSIQNEAPYCFTDADAGTCGLYNFSSLPEGRHEIRVVATSEGDQVVEKSVGFVVGSENKLAPSVNASALEEYSDPNAVDNMALSVEGISENDIVTGYRSVSAQVSGANAPVTVRFAINSTDINAASSAPYCLVDADIAGVCGEWNSESLVNGEYTLLVIASAEGSKEKTVAIPFTVNNPTVKFSAGVDDQEAVVGNPNQQIAGKSKVTLPASKLKNATSGRKIEYFIDNQLVATTYDSSPVVEVDTSGFSNGAHVLSAKITNVSGESTSLSSTVIVQNDIFTSINTWIRTNLARSLLAALFIGVAIFFTFRKVMAFVHERRLERAHNISDTYKPAEMYVPVYGPMSLHNHYAQAVASFAILFLGSVLVLRMGATQAGVGTGFIEDIEDATQATQFIGFGTYMDANDMRINYARLNYSDAIADELMQDDIEAQPAEANDEATLGAATDPAVLQSTTTSYTATFQGESMTLPQYTGRVQSESGANGGQSLFIWSTAAAVRSSYSIQAANLVTIRARGDQCDGAPIMSLRINGASISTAQVSANTFSDYRFPVSLAAGTYTFEVGFTNDYGNATCNRNIYVDQVTVSNTTSTTGVQTTPSSPTPTTSVVTTFEGETMSLTAGAGRVNSESGASGGQTLFNWGITNGVATASKTHTVGAGNGVRIRAKGDQCNGAPNMELKVDGRVVSTSPVSSTGYQDYFYPVTIAAGSRTFEISFNNDLYTTCDRNLYIDSVSVVTLAAAPSPSPTPTPTPAPTPTPTPPTFFEGETMSFAQQFTGQVNSESNASGGQSIWVWSTATVTKTVTTIAGKGITVKARGDQCNGAPIMSVAIDGTNIFATQVTGTVFVDYSFPINITAGSHKIDISFTNDYYVVCDRNLYVDSVTITATAPTTSATPAPAPSPTPTPTPTPSPTPSPTPTPTPTPTPPPSSGGPYLNTALIPPRLAGASGPLMQYGAYDQSFADSIGAFRTDCKVSHITRDDPIVYPGQTGAAHWHSFFGNTGVNAFTTADSLRNSGNSTCSGGTLNRSGYWMPTVINTRTGAPVMPERVLIYYKTSYYLQNIPTSQFSVPPAGLRMIAGDARATSVQSKDPYGHSISSFACNSESHPFPVVTGGNTIDTYCPEGARQLFMEIRFPQCWSGNLDSPDHKSHMAYPNGYNCPSSHPVAIPEIQLRVKYNYYDPDRAYWKLSSDMYSGPGGYSNHADWWNGWDTNLLNQIRQYCWGASRDCQVDYVGNNQKLAPY